MAFDVGSTLSGIGDSISGLLGSTPLGRIVKSNEGNFGSLTGTSAGAPPALANVTGSLQPGQLRDNYTDTQTSLGAQQRLLAALQAQRGLQDQSNIYAGQGTLASQLGGGAGYQQNALAGQSGLNQGLAGLGGAGNLGSTYAQSQALANQMGGVNGTGNLEQALQSQRALAEQQQGVLGQYQDLAAGRGPNPAMAALAQQTGANVANQAALMAGQRGAGSNVGLMARQASQAGAAAQQQAVGQGATLQAQQQLNALQGITGQQQAIGATQNNVANIAQTQQAAQQAQQQALAAQAAQQVGFQQSGIGQQAQLGQALTGQQQAQQQAMANQANLMAQNQIGTQQNYSQNQLAQQQLSQNALASQNQANVSNQGSVNSANAGLAQSAMKGRQDLSGGVLQAGTKGAAAMMADGGDVPAPVPAAPAAPAAPMAPAAPVPVAPVPVAPAAGGAQSSFVKFLKGATAEDPNAPKGQTSALKEGAGDFASGIGKLAMAARGGMTQKHDYRADGGSVKAKDSSEKAVKPGNSYANDKIKAVLSEGEVVLPRSVMQSKDPVKASADFVAKVMAKRRQSA